MQINFAQKIRHRLLLSTLLGSGAALVLVGTIFAGIGIDSLEDRLEHRLRAQADLIAGKVAAPLRADDPAAARELLSALRVDPAIRMARVMRNDGRLLASYGAKAGIGADDTLIVEQSVEFGDGVVGRVLLSATRPNFDDEIQAFVPILGIALFAALLLSLLLTHWIHRAVIDPISGLVGVARRVTEAKDYTARAERLHDDELGLLTDAFNLMLEKVERREQSLERKVALRTRALRKSIRRLEQEIEERQEFDHLLEVITEGVSDKIGDEYFHALVMTMARALNTKFAFAGWLDPVTRAHVDTIAVYGHGRRQDNFRYELANTPCDNVLDDRACVYPREVQRLFPDDRMLVDMGFESYAGVPVRDLKGEVVGLLVVLDTQPLAKPAGVLTVLNLVALRTATEMQHRIDALELRKLSMAVDQSPSLVAILDPDGIIEYVNPRLCEVTGYQAGELIGRPHDVFRATEARDEDYRSIWDTVVGGREWHGELTRRCKDGSTYWASVRLRPLIDDAGAITHVLSTQEDVTEARKLSDQLAYQAAHDPLTGMVNRTEFERRVQAVLDAVGGEAAAHAICYIDLDQFKVVNDTCGHVAGDVLLQQVAELWKSRVRRSDTLARLGGDEFGLLMVGCDLHRAQAVAGSLREAIEAARFNWEGRIFRITCSIGLVGFSDATDDVTELMRKADSACYAAKDSGRNRIHLHAEDDERLARRHGEMQWVARINDALENDRLCLYAQPILSLHEDRPLWSHFEVLVRMIDDDGGTIPPGAFLGAAERYNLAAHIDRWVLHATLTWLSARTDLLSGVSRCSINLSAVSLTEDGFLDYVLGSLRESRVRPDQLCFEITETAAITNMVHASHFMDAVRVEGCCFALDDFGSGLSSFAYLKALPVSVLKIDGAFVRDMLTDPINHAMVRAIDQVGKVMDKQTVAEFVENADIVEVLRTLGVDYAQGYGIGKPIAIEDIPLLPVGGTLRLSAGGT